VRFFRVVAEEDGVVLFRSVAVFFANRFEGARDGAAYGLFSGAGACGN